MSKNKNIKKMFEREFDIENMKEEIFLNEKKSRINLKNYFKVGLIPISLIACIFFIKVNTNEILKSEITEKTDNNILINVNKINDMSECALRLDADIKTVDKEASVKNGRFENIQGLEEYPFYKDIVISSEYNDFTIYGIYTNNDEKKDYQDILDNYPNLNNYVISYKVKNPEKEFKQITISFSKDNKPIRDYYFKEEDSKVSKINNIELKIFKYEKLFFTEFNYNGINFDIETSNIKEEELINLLVSIIK